MKGQPFEMIVRLILGLVLVCLLELGTVGPASAASIIYVKYNATGMNNGTSWANAYKNLQQALSVAGSGQQIWVAKGTYRPTGTTDNTISFVLKNGVQIYGGFAGGEPVLSQRNPSANITILSGDIGQSGIGSDNSYHVVDASGTDRTAVLDGFRIVEGYANGEVYSYWSVGGGVFAYDGSPTLKNVIFIHNRAFNAGGGLYNWNGSPALTNVTLMNNQSEDMGGGMYSAGGGTPTLTNVAFRTNLGGFAGGGLALRSAATLAKVTFSQNYAIKGGGLYLSDSATQSLTNVIFDKNWSRDSGGGIFSQSASPTITNATFSGNTSQYGGGMFIDIGSPLLMNVTFSGNQGYEYGGGIYNQYSGLTLKNATFTGNTARYGGGMYNNLPYDVSIHIYNSIFWGNSAREIYEYGLSSTIASSIIRGGCPAGSTCTGRIINADPQLGPLQNNGAFTKNRALGLGSPAIDRGNNATCAPRDQRDVVRPQGGTCDIGAYEVKTKIFTSSGAYDGQVLESGQNTNIGGGANSSATTLRVGDNSANRRFRGFLSFNTGPLPEGSVIVRARLSILKQSASGNPFRTQGSLVIDLANPWFGSGPGLEISDWQASAAASPAGSFRTTLLPDGSWYAAWLSTSVLSNINRVGTTQFRLGFSSEQYNGLAENLSFYSGNAAIAVNRPLLIVYYNP